MNETPVTTCEVQQISILAAGLDQPLIQDSELFSVQSVQRGSEVLALLRVTDFDLLLAGESIADMSVWTLLERVRRFRPKQRWALAGENLTPQDEIRARALGALMVLDLPPDKFVIRDLMSSLLNRRRAHSVEQQAAAV